MPYVTASAATAASSLQAERDVAPADPLRAFYVGKHLGLCPTGLEASVYRQRLVVAR